MPIFIQISFLSMEAHYFQNIYVLLSFGSLKNIIARFNLFIKDLVTVENVGSFSNIFTSDRSKNNLTLPQVCILIVPFHTHVTQIPFSFTRKNHLTSWEKVAIHWCLPTFSKFSSIVKGDLAIIVEWLRILLEHALVSLVSMIGSSMKGHR